MLRKAEYEANVKTDFVAEVRRPVVAGSAYITPQAFVNGEVTIGERVFVGPFASVRGDEGVGIHIGDDSNVQDGVVVHALETQEGGKTIEENVIYYEGKSYAVYVGKRVSLAHQCHVHGPALVEDDTFVGMQALVVMSRVGKGCVIEPGAKLMGVTVAAGRYVPMGQVVTTQEAADGLPEITADYRLARLNEEVVKVNIQLAAGYRRREGR